MSVTIVQCSGKSFITLSKLRARSRLQFTCQTATFMLRCFCIIALRTYWIFSLLRPRKILPASKLDAGETTNSLTSLQYSETDREHAAKSSSSTRRPLSISKTALVAWSGHRQLNGDARENTTWWSRVENQTTDIALDYEEQWNCPVQNLISKFGLSYNWHYEVAHRAQRRRIWKACAPGPSQFERVIFRERGITEGFSPDHIFFWSTNLKSHCECR